MPFFSSPNARYEKKKEKAKKKEKKAMNESDFSGGML